MDTPQGEAVGSSVQSGHYKKSNAYVPLEGNSSDWQVDGEAVVVALPRYQFLFALLKGSTTFGEVHHILQSVVSPKIGPRSREALVQASNQRIGATFNVDDRSRPLLVTFTDVQDPTSVRKVNPENLAETFGAGIRLSSITISVSDESVTDGPVGKALRWLCSYKMPYRSLNGKTEPIATNDLADTLGPSAFKIGECKSKDLLLAIHAMDSYP